MEGNWRPTQSAAAEVSMASSIDASSGAGGDWRSQLQPEARQRIVNKIMETLKRHLSITVPEGLNELRKIAIWIEEKIYYAATNQSDYLRKISLKMLSMATKNPPAAPINPGMSSPATVNQNPTDSASVESTAQTGHAGAIDLQEECYQKVKSMKELYFAELTEFHSKIALRLQQQEALIPPGKQVEQHEKLKGFIQMLERMLALLQTSKNNIPVRIKEKLPLYEKQILSMVASNKALKMSPQVQRQQLFQHPNVGNAQPIPQQQQSQNDHLRKISPKMLAMEKRTPQSAPINPAIPNGEAVNQNPTYQGNIFEAVTPKHPNKRLHISSNRSIVNCDLEDDSHLKRMKVSEPAPSQAVQEEPSFSCPICMCALVSPFTTVCGHIFCEGCIKAAAKNQKKCPTCRSKLTGRNNIHRVFLPATYKDDLN